MIGILFLREIWNKNPDNVADNDLNDNEDLKQTLSSNVSIFQEYSNIFNINAFDLSGEILMGYAKKDMLHHLKYSKSATNKITEFFKLIIVFFSITLK